MRQTLRIEEPGAERERNEGARRLALGGLVAGLVPLVLLGPMFVYQMEFMLYTWAWPTLAGALGLGLSGLAWHRAGADRSGRWLAVAGLIISGLGLAVALAGWLGMMATMVTPMPAMPMQ